MMAKAVTPLAEVLHSTRKNIVNVHTSYYESFFLLSVDVWVDGFPLQLEGHDQSSLGLSSPIDDVAIPVKMLAGAVGKAAERFGVHQLARMRCGSCPLFEVDFTTKKSATKFCKALAAGRVQDAMVESISCLVEHTLESSRLSVASKLLFVTPKSTRSDTILREVTKANCSKCFELLCEGLAFDFGDLVRQSRLECHSQKELQLPVLMNELEAVDHWFSLGFYLNIPMLELERLKLTYGYRKEGMHEMLQAWLKTGETSYATLVDALVGIGMLSLARKIAVKYGIITEKLGCNDTKKDDMHFQNAATAAMPGYVSALKEARHQVMLADAELFKVQREISRMETLRSEVGEWCKHTKLSIKQEAKSIEQLNKELLGLQDQRNKKEQQKEWLMAQMTTQEQTMQMTAAIQMLQETAIVIQQLNHQIEEVESNIGSRKSEVESLELKLVEQEQQMSENDRRLFELQLNYKEVKMTLWLGRKHFDLQMQQMMAAQKSSKDLQRELQNQIASLQDEVAHQKKEIDTMTSSSDENVNKVRQQQLSITNRMLTSMQEQIATLQLQLTAFRRRKSPKIAHKSLPSEPDSSDPKKLPSTVPLDESAKSSRSPTASPDYPSQDALMNNTIKVTLKKSKQQLGFSLTGGEREGRTIRIHSVAADGLASQDGRLKEGDILVSINSETVLGSHRDLAVAILESIPINTDIEIEVYRSESSTQQKTKTKSRVKRPLELGGTPKPSIKAFGIVKSANGFGFSIGDSAEGIIVKQVLDKERCSCLREGDIIVGVSSGLSHQPLSPTSTVAKFVTYLKRIDTGSQATFHVCRPSRTASPISKSHEPPATPPCAPVPYCVPVQSGDGTGSPLFQVAPYNKLHHTEPAAVSSTAVPYCVPVQSGEAVSSPLARPSSYNRLQRAFDRRFSGSQAPYLCREIRLTSQPSAGFGFRIRGGREEGFIPTVVNVTSGEAADNAGLTVGDQIIFVNGQPVADASYNDIVKLIKEAAIKGQVTLSIDSSS